MYFSHSKNGFHRVGFYSNVDSNFLPVSMRNHGYISLYVEKSFKGGSRQDDVVPALYNNLVIQELQDLGYIGNVIVSDGSWIDIAYTWAYPGSDWKEEAIGTLERHDIYQIGRYGKWQFQGVADSIFDGMTIS